MVEACRESLVKWGRDDVPTQLMTGTEEFGWRPYIGEEAKAWYSSAEACARLDTYH